MRTTFTILAEGSSVAMWIPVGLVVVALFWLIGVYNGLIRLQQHTKESWSGIDTELKRRYDLIPNLVETVKGYAAHEKSVLTRVIEARNSAQDSNGSPEHQAADENTFVGAVNGMLMLAENYPDLKASVNFLALQQELANTEDRIQAARRFYNANVRDLNTRCRTFPSSLVASMAKITTAEFFEVQSAAVRVAPVVSV
jgi:LemA protein